MPMPHVSTLTDRSCVLVTSGSRGTVSPVLLMHASFVMSMLIVLPTFVSATLDTTAMGQPVLTKYALAITPTGLKIEMGMA